MTMTKKDYELVAHVFQHADDGNGYKHYILLALATAFENENPSFDREKFLRASGILPTSALIKGISRTKSSVSSTGETL